MLPMDSLGFNIIEDNARKDEGKVESDAVVDRAMLVNAQRGMSDSGVWECNVCYYLNSGDICGGLWANF